MKKPLNRMLDIFKRPIRLRKLVFSMNVIVLTIGMTLSPCAEALKLKILKDRYVRSLESKGREAVGHLMPGSVVEFPDKYVVRDQDGKVNLERSLVRWLKEAQADTSDPDTALYPMKIVSATEGSQVEGLKTDKSYFISIGYLARIGQVMVVSDPAPVYDSPEKASAPKKAEKKNESTISDQTKKKVLEADLACSQGPCAEAAALNQLVQYIDGALSAADHSTIQKQSRTLNDFKRIKSTFERTCKMRLEDFAQEVIHRSSSEGIPPDLILSMMTVESSGNCQVEAKEPNGRTSVGLFQIDSQATKYSRAQLKNPSTALTAVIAKLKQKANYLTSAKNGFDRSRLIDNDGNWTRLMARIAVSAYNGGEKWVLRAKEDLETFNSKHGTNLDPYKWEDLRIFYMRSHLDRYEGAHIELFGGRKSLRAQNFSIMNLAHTETIVPRATVAQSDTTTLPGVWVDFISEVR